MTECLCRCWDAWPGLLCAGGWCPLGGRGQGLRPILSLSVVLPAQGESSHSPIGPRLQLFFVSSKLCRGDPLGRVFQSLWISSCPRVKTATLNFLGCLCAVGAWLISGASAWREHPSPTSVPGASARPRAGVGMGQGCVGAFPTAAGSELVPQCGQLQMKQIGRAHV